ncbi:unnamed protein product [Urochloa humidicola]
MPAVSLAMTCSVVVAMISLHLFAVLVAECSGVATRSKGSIGDRAPSIAPASGCPDRCGNLTFDFPFGIGPDCSRSSDFELTCDNSTQPPKLFFQNYRFTQVMDSIVISSTESMDTSSEHGVSTGFTYTISINSSAPVIWSFSRKPPGKSFSDYMSLGMMFSGCDFDVHWENPPASRLASETSCTATCPPGELADTGATVGCGDGTGIGCCSILFGDRIDSVKLKFVRRGNGSSKSHHSRSFLWNTVTVTDAFGEGISWKIIDQPTCAIARKHKATYACVSRGSTCIDIGSDFGDYGYNCKCRTRYSGNPYILDGCKLDNGYSPIQPNKNCTRLCGNISVPFPFGLEDGCFARKQFRLDCNNTTPAILQTADFSHRVTNIYVDKGILEYITANTNNAETDIVIWDDVPSLYVYPQDSAVISVEWRTGGYVGYRCRCIPGYQGNPYVQNGCTDIDECLQRNICPEMCNNTIGNYTCVECPHKTEYDTVKGYCIRKHQNLLLGVAIGLSVGFGTLLLCLSGVFLIHRWRRDIQNKIRKKYFRKNKGLLLEQLISSDDKSSDNTIFSLKELQKATNDFDHTRILGSGGHGMVYKGILSDQRVVAIKKPKVIDEGEINQFINEVAILSQINHRNIVRLLGCCLETEVPLLVYDFIPNGSLFKMIHEDQSNKEFSLSWHDSLRIATEAAGALCYLHSAASVSVFHRDVKSSNILLDGSYTAKVSDFGASRLIPIDQTHVITNVQGTFGYLDPEYYHTGQLNEKSDVYSFGVVLLELLLRKQPIFTIDSGPKINLSNYFLSEIRTRPITEMVASQVLEQASEDEINTVASLAEECLRLRGEERPTMKQVEMKLQLLRNKGLRSCNGFPESSYEIQAPQPIRLAAHRCQSLSIVGDGRANIGSSSCHKLEQEFMSFATLPR